MIIATAGHVDHGKTTLVRALTGVDTDRLAEEQRRGMTIEPGFAYADWPADRPAGAPPAAEPIGFVDVPGHERLIRNMLAGVAAVDAALLVVAADDGPMPQTREHLALLQLLDVPRLVVALTKIDRTAPARRAEVGRDIGALLADSPWPGAPLFEVAAPAGTGVAALQAHLGMLARSAGERPATGGFRLAIDRSFTLAGAGRVVTGAVLSGEVRVGDTVLLSPQGGSARVRSLHALGRPADSARAGQRCALNLAGTELRRAEPQRGDWLLSPDLVTPSDRLDVRLTPLPPVAGAAAGWAAALRSGRAVLHLHLGAAVRQARLQWLDAAGGLARLQLDQPVAAAWADRFILRDPAAHDTLAGGQVIDPLGPARGAGRPARLAELRVLDQADHGAALRALLEATPQGLDLERFARGRNLRPDEAAALEAATGLQRLAGRPAWGVSRAHWLAWRARLLGTLARVHAAQPERQGLDEAGLSAALADTATAHTSKAGGDSPATDGRPATPLGPDARRVWCAALAALVAEGAVQRRGVLHHLPGHQVQLPEDEARLLDQLQALLPAAGLRPPIVGELATQLGLPLAALKARLDALTRRGLLVPVAPNRWYLPETAAQLADEARAVAAARGDGCVDAAGYRDRTGIGRNLTVEVLEYLDRAGVSRFDGRLHRLRA